MVLGGHGDTMVPIARLTSVSGIPLSEAAGSGGHRSFDRPRAQWRRRNREVSETGSAYYTPSAAAVEMVESILKDKKKVLPCAAFLEENTESRISSLACQ